MRYLVGFVLVLALVASPLSTSAQDAEEGETSEPSAEESTPSAEPAGDDGGLSPRVRKTTRQQWGPHAYELPSTSKGQVHGRQGMHPAGIMFLTMSGVTVVGAVLVGVGMTRPSTGDLNRDIAPVAAGAVLMMIGGVGMIISGVVWGKRTRQGRRLKEARYERPRRVQWDPAQSRVVF
jgi:hypothetical protein